MSNSFKQQFTLPPEQQAIRDKCSHPSETFVEFPDEDVESSIPARFEKIVRLYPERLAVKDKGRSVTYDELNRAANRIAHTILGKCGRESEPIVLLFDEVTDAIAVLFGVLKAGKFYVFIDPSFPLERISYILEDCGAGLIVTDSRNLDRANELKNDTRTLLNINEISDSSSSDNLSLSVSPDDLVTIGYTSGSTGKPKGVVQAHRNVLSSVKILSERYGVSVNDRLTLLHSLSFDSGHLHLRVSLLNGASLFPFDIKSEGVHHLGKWLEEEQLTVYHSPPALFRQLAESLSGREKFATLRLIHLSGAPVTRLDFDLYKKNFSPETLLEFGMGSTEAREIASAIVDRTFTFPDEGVPIGYPPPEKKLLLLEENGHEVELGEVGEIAVKGRNINPGYWNQPGLTGAKFLADPLGGDERIYLTGDLGRMLPDGSVIHLGRKDLMIKIRGYRVEIGEIERALSAHPLIKDAGVAAWDLQPEEKTLIAYVVAHQQPVLTVAELSSYLRNHLPDYMIPPKFVFLDSLPRTNGKLERSALPKPEGDRPELNQPYVGPQTEIEHELVRMWEEVLDVHPIGIQDNFFDLGGHSLAATRIQSRIARMFLVGISLNELFQTPTIAGLAGRIAATPKLQVSRPNIDPIRQHQVIDSYPLSLTQQRLWFLHQLEPESCAYNLLSVTRLIGPLDVPALKQSYNNVIERHDALRTIFANHNGIARQVILPSLALDLTVVDLCQTANDVSPKIRVSTLARELAQIPFDLAAGPLLRVKLLRVAEDQYVLLQVIHHIVYDAWSIGIFARDLSHFYNAIVKGETPALQPLSIHYSNFATWQHERFQANEFRDDLDYWKRQLADLADLQMPTDHPRPAIQTHRGGKISFVLNEALTGALKKLSRNANATLFMTLLAAFQTLLHRYTSQVDIAVGTAIDGRPQREAEDVIGFFLNTLVIRTPFSGNPTFRELLDRVQKVCLGAFHHRDLPFETLVEALQPERRLSHNPLFQVGFVLQNAPEFKWRLSGVAAQKWELYSGIAQFELNVFMEEDGQTLKGSASFNTDLFNASTIERMLGHFQTLLEAIVANPDQRIGELPLLTEAEKHQMLVEWNDTKADHPKDKCIHTLFEEQVERNPDAVAVVFENQRISYRDLNTRANQLACYLKKLGVGADVLVGICVERSIELIVALLGVFKAGGAYVPLDPSYPAQRLEFMLADARAAILLTQGELFDDCEAGRDDGEPRSPILEPRMNRVYLDRDWQLIARESGANPETSTTADNLAYVIYTSGSTGTPKGVMIEHRGLSNVAEEQRRRFALSQVDRVLQFASLSFDASIFEIMIALTGGARLYLSTPKTLLVGSTLTDFLRRHEITIATLPPSVLASLSPKALPALRSLCVAGEACSAKLVEEWAVDRLFFNLYGPTETTIWATAAECDSRAGQVSIGRPIANSQIYLLDVYQQPVPIGVPGEICIGGFGVARGYLNRPELTTEKFIPNPFSSKPGARLYRSGDLARYLPDGNLEFLGRIDNQVKIRGFRIDLGEIEAVLAHHPAIQQSVVLVREDTPGDKRLVAYVVSANGSAPSAQNLRSYLQHKLPDYMVPSAFVFLDSLPLTPNGKLDRNSLPAPDHTRPELEGAFAAPRTFVEEILANIWAEVLKVDKVGIHDNFFHLGGHSLLATQVVSRIRDALKFDLQLKTLFEAPTIEGIAQNLQDVRDKQDVAQTAQIAPAAREHYRLQKTNH